MVANAFAFLVLLCAVGFAIFTIALWRRREARLDRLAAKGLSPRLPAAAPTGNGLATPHRAGYRFASDGLRARPRLPRFAPRELTAEPVTRLGQLASPYWSRRARHVGVVARMRQAPSGRAYARLTYINRAGSVMLPLGALRRVG